MGRVEDLKGNKYGKLETIKYIGKNGTKQSWWECRCDCGNTKNVRASDLKRGKTKSCGCIQEEFVSNLNKTHGLTGEPLYTVWQNIKARCYNENNPRYEDWGGRGVKMCDEWKDDFESFYSWALGNGYKDGLSIERIDNNGNYEPGNCCWIPNKKQASNTRKNKFVEINGVRNTMAGWAEHYGIDKVLVYKRKYKGWPEKYWFVEKGTTLKELLKDE